MSSELLFAAAGGPKPLTIKLSANAKVMRLRIDRKTGDVILTLPSRASRRRALQWAAEQRPWVEKVLADLPGRRAIVPGATIPFRGAPHLVDWQGARPRTVRLEPGRLLVGGPAETVEGRVTRWLRQQALALLSDETAYYAGLAGVGVSRVGIGDPVSRWGSCSTTGAIRYSWRLILAPDFVRRATVAHEVAHRVHMNHGPQFHALVDRLFEGDPSAARAWLKREGAALHQIGGRA